MKKEDIELNGLTVIAGENDSGKSTVGKILYSVIKIISQSKIITTSNLDSLIKLLHVKLYNRHHKNL